MATVTRAVLSGSTNGRGIQTNGRANGYSNTLLHTSVSGTSDWDEVWVWAVCPDAPMTGEWPTASAHVAELVKLGFGLAQGPTGVGSKVLVDAGPVLIVPGWMLNNEKTVRVGVSRGWLDSAHAVQAVSTVCFYGHVNQIRN